MAVLNFHIDLKGGDAVTPNSGLKFKIYGNADAFAAAIHSTGIVSEDLNISIIGDLVTIENVDVGAETIFKITTIDAVGNESLKSVSYTFTYSEKRKSIIVTSTSNQTSYPIYLKVYNTAGTDTPNSIYLDGKVRADWGDIVIRKADLTSIAYGILEEYPTYIVLAFKADVINGDTTFYIDYNIPERDRHIIKIGVTSDQHYDPLETYVNRDQTLARLDNFKARMIEYQPDLILEGGDKIGQVTTDPSGRLTIMQQVTAKHTETATAVGCPSYLWGWGNHDFQQITFASVLGEYGGSLGMVAGKLYATWSDDNFTYISLDTNYKPADDTHMDNAHQGFGYIDAPQLSWLTDTLAAATKPCIVMGHHPFCEADTEKYFLTKETYHTQNRVAVRDILEASGKVLCSISGHMHATFINVINGISYLGVSNVNEPPSQQYNYSRPNPTEGVVGGNWTIIEIDKKARTILFKRETKLDSAVVTVTQYKVPFKTLFDPDYGDNLSETFSLGYAATYEKPSIIEDATDLYINNRDYIVTIPALIYLDQPRLSSRTFKLLCLTSAPNYGKADWYFAPQTGNFKIRFKALISAIGTKVFKIYNTDASTTVGLYFGFYSDGNIKTANKPSASAVAMAYTINTWYEFEIIVRTASGKYDVKIDGTTLITDNGFYETGTATLKSLQILTEAGELMIDNFRIEKYATPTPAISSFGAETDI